MSFIPLTALTSGVGEATGTAYRRTRARGQEELLFSGISATVNSGQARDLNPELAAAPSRRYELSVPVGQELKSAG